MKRKQLCRINSIGFLVVLMLLVLNGRSLAFCVLGICIPPLHHPHSAPEIDARMAVSGVTLLIAATLTIVERFRR
jgi:hypothetical protein